MFELPGRPDFWNIGFPLFGMLVYLSAPICLAFIFYGIIRRVKLWQIGTKNIEQKKYLNRIHRFYKEISIGLLAHKKFSKKRHMYPAIMHLSIFWGFIILFIATTIGAIEFNFHKYFGVIFPTAPYRVEMGLIWDLGGLLATVGVAMAVWRRYVIKPSRLNTMLDDTMILIILALLILSGFILEGLRIGATELNPYSELFNPDNAKWSIIGWLFAKSFILLKIPISAMEILHRSFWWSHAILFTAGLSYGAIKFSHISHIYISPLNIFFRSFRKSGELKPMDDFESLESFGARTLKDFSWNELMAYDSCTNCGRCEEMCPAWSTKKPLSPRKVIQDMRNHMEEEMISYKKNLIGSEFSIAKDVIGDEVLWSCLTCGACIDICPVNINQVDTIIGLRRFLTLEDASIPSSAQSTIENIEQRGHPWRGTEYTRTSWMDGLEIKTFEENPNTEFLFWVGCTGALTKRGVESTRSMAKILKKAGIDFAVLGNNETCTGDPARRMGNEYLFQIKAKENIKTFENYEIKKIISTCPHCFNTIKNEYPQFNGKYEIEHYTSFVGKLIKKGLLNPKAVFDSKKFTYHDSCYLGRHNELISEPRKIISSIKGLNFTEIQNNKTQSFCCGAGGGRMWMEESGQRINHKRVDDFIATGADTLVVSCGFCIQMMDEGIASNYNPKEKNTIDLITLLDKST